MKFRLPLINIDIHRIDCFRNYLEWTTERLFDDFFYRNYRDDRLSKKQWLNASGLVLAYSLGLSKKQGKNLMGIKMKKCLLDTDMLKNISIKKVKKQSLLPSLSNKFHDDNGIHPSTEIKRRLYSLIIISMLQNEKKFKSIDKKRYYKYGWLMVHTRFMFIDLYEDKNHSFIPLYLAFVKKPKQVKKEWLSSILENLNSASVLDDICLIEIFRAAMTVSTGSNIIFTNSMDNLLKMENIRIKDKMCEVIAELGNRIRWSWEMSNISDIIHLIYLSCTIDKTFDIPDNIDQKDFAAGLSSLVLLMFLLSNKKSNYKLLRLICEIIDNVI